MTVAVFPCLPNALEPYRVRVSLSTDVISAYEDQEQRIQLRRIPRRREAFVARSLRAAEMARLDALAIGGQTQQWILPYWPHGTQLTASAGPGADTLLCETADRDFVNGDPVVLWQGSGTFEAATITSLSAGQIGATLADAWPEGTWAFPGRLARWATDPAMRRIMQAGADATVAFDLEGLTDPGVATPASPQVFTVAYPDRFREEPTDRLGRSVARFDSPTGAFADYARGPTPIGQHSLALWLASLADVNLLLTWYYGLKGALTPFWLPTYQADCEPIADVGAGDTAITIIAQNYTAWSFPTGVRGHLACVGADGTLTHRQVVAAVDNGDGTETLTLDAPVGVAVPRQGGLISQLLYVRLAQDALEVQWTAPNLAEATLQVVEIPRTLAAPSFPPPAPGAVSPPGSVGSIGFGSGGATATSGTGSVPTHGTAGHAVNILVQAKDAAGVDLTTGGATVVVSITGANTATPTVTDNGDGTYTASYTPGTAGTDAVAVTLNGVAIAGSPFTVTIADVVSATDSTAVVPDVRVGSPRLVVVTAKDASGNPLTVGGATVAVTVTGANAQTPTVTDNGNGTYQAVLSSATAGSDSVAITLNSTAISGSPYTSVVSAAPTITGLAVSPSSVSLNTSATQQFRATASFSDGTTGPVAVTWSAGGGTITSGGLYTAGGATGSFAVRATSVATPTVIAIASVTITAAAVAPPPMTGVPPVPAGLTLFARCACTAKPPDGTWVSGPTYGVPAGVMQQYFMEPAADPGMLISPPGTLGFVLQTGKLPGSSSGTIKLWKDHPGTEMKELFEVGCIRFGGLKPDGTLTNDYEQQAVGTKIFGFWGVATDPALGQAASLFMGCNGNGATSILTSFKVHFFQQSPGPVVRNLYQNLNLGTLLRAGAATNYAVYLKLNDIGSANGIVRIWLGTTQITEYTNVTFRTAGFPHGFWRRHWNVTWGGRGGTPKTREDRIRVDDVSLYGVAL